MNRQGVRVIGIDPSEELIKIGQSNFDALDLLVAGMEDLPLSDTKFDGLWDNAVFHHQPRSNMSLKLAKMPESLNDQGVIYIAAKMGEGVASKDHGESGEITFTLLQPDELEGLLTRNNS